MKRMIWLMIAVLLLPALAWAQEATYTLTDEKGTVITYYCGECSQGDEYISGDNRHYRVTKVDDAARTAQLEALGAITLPDVGWLDENATQPVSASGKEKKIALYCTHSDESYEKGDGETSNEKRGGIYDIAKAFAGDLEKLGVTVERSDATHHPHDAGAYRRSRQTAVALLKGAPNAIFDLHRDGIPDPDEYATTLGNTKASKVRLLVGRGNQNNEANLSLAKQIKAVGDKVYPELIKDIYMGKGSYNQDLAPRSVLLEFGTHTLAKERVLASTGPMSEVVYKTLYGGVVGSAGASDVRGSSSEKTDGSAGTVGTPEDNVASGSGIVWLIVALVAGLLIFGVLATGSGKGGVGKLKRSFSEMTGGLFGKKPRS